MTHHSKFMLELETILDRFGERILYLATGLMLALFASFVLVLMEARQAKAESINAASCGGENLIARYAADEPEKLALLEQQASSSLYGNSIFWKIEKDGTKPSYVLGTMHMADKRIAKLDSVRLNAFEASNTVIVENIEALDPGQASAAMFQHKDMTLYTDGTTLSDRLDEETLGKLRTAAEQRGIPFAMLQIMRPWLVATSIALPACEIAAQGTNQPVLDGLIVKKAKEAGKELVGLESIGEQFTAISSLPEDFHLRALKETLNMGSLAEDVMETMKLLYLEGRIGMIMPLTKLVSPQTAGGEGYRDFQENLITKRNAIMVERSLPHLEKGSAFIAVGALHLPDESGLINQFTKAGYTVTPVR